MTNRSFLNHYQALTLAIILFTPAFSSAASMTPALQWRDPADPALAPSIKDAKASIQQLVTTLSAALTAAVQEGGLNQGVVICQTQALPLTQASFSGSPSRVTGLKRTSLKVRNPANAPDSAEEAALVRVAQMLADGDPLPDLLVQQISATAESDPELRIYKPLKVAAKCLACHGDPATFSTKLRTSLAQRYPQDTATGYAAGDWRGLIRASLRP